MEGMWDGGDVGQRGCGMAGMWDGGDVGWKGCRRMKDTVGRGEVLSKTQVAWALESLGREAES